MKVRKKDVCHTCRRRKLRCDGKRPACSQCLSSNRLCEGYPDILFVPFSTTPRVLKPTSPPVASNGTSKLTRQHQRPAGAAPSFGPQPTSTHVSQPIFYSQGDRSLPLGPSSPNILVDWPCNHPVYTLLPAALHDNIQLIINNYVPRSELQRDVVNFNPHSPRICGSWVTALPGLTLGATGALGECLDSAIHALALSITACRTGKELLRPISFYYAHTLRLLQSDLQMADRAYKSERVAVAMCLALLEVLSPTKSYSWLVHVGGVSELIGSLSPEFFSGGVHHTLFVGFRPLLILRAFMLRQATFFADQDWVEKPFQRYKATPLQNLLSLAAKIPKCLEDIDAIEDQPPTSAMIAASETLAELLEIRAGLDSWSCSLTADSSAPPFWHLESGDTVECHNNLLWFRDLSAANLYTHLWSFQVICLSHIQNLLVRYPELERFHVATLETTTQLRDACVKLSIMIFQSMEYILQEDFMLYGFSSAGFPLYTACKALELDEQGRAVLGTLDRTVLDRSDIQKMQMLH